MKTKNEPFVDTVADLVRDIFACTLEKVMGRLE